MARTLWLALCGLVGLAVAAFAQPGAGEIALLNRGGYYGNALIALNNYGALTTIVPLPAGGPSGITVHGLGGEDLIVDGKRLYSIKNGVLRTLTASLAQSCRDVEVDEDGTYVLLGESAILTLNGTTGVRGTLATGLMAPVAFAYNGTDGTFVVLDAAANRLLCLERTGVVRAIIGMAEPRCATWDAFTGRMFVATRGALLAVDPGGKVVTLSTGTPGLQEPVGIFLRSDRTLLIAQGGAGRTGVYAYHGDTGRYDRTCIESVSSETGISPADLTVEHSRDLWPRGPARVGETLVLNVNFPQFKLRQFVVALSLGHTPGIQLGNYRLHLVPDVLFFTSLLNRGLLEGTGMLSASSGTGTARVHIPKVEELAGLRVFAGAVVLDPRAKDGVGMTSYGMGFTIGPPAHK